MAERKAVNKYYPPDWDPRKGSANKRVGQHPLRDRAKKLSQGILVIRFELPYNIWCGGCGSHVGMGVRYNAEKSKVGNYYSTPIYKFRMKCHLCDNYFEIQTDPKNHDYVILCGARRKEQRWDPVANEQVVPEDKNTQKKLATDAMFKLEHGSNDQQKGAEKTQSLAVLEESKISMKDDYILNRMARDRFRTEKKLMKEAQDADNAILKRNSLDISLVEETEEDRKLATLMKYSVTTSYEEKQKERRKSIELRPLFNPQTSSIKGKELKLGKALEASYKDPFQTSKKKPQPKLSKHSLVVIKRRKAGKHLAKAARKELLREGLKRKPVSPASLLEQDCVSKPGSSESILKQDCVSKPGLSASILEQDCVSKPGSPGSILKQDSVLKPGSFGSMSVQDLVLGTVLSTPGSSDILSGSLHEYPVGQHTIPESDHRTVCDSTYLTEPPSRVGVESCDDTSNVETGEKNRCFNAKSGLFSLMSSYADSDSDSALSVS